MNAPNSNDAIDQRKGSSTFAWSIIVALALICSGIWRYYHLNVWRSEDVHFVPIPGTQSEVVVVRMYSIANGTEAYLLRTPSGAVTTRWLSSSDATLAEIRADCVAEYNDPGLTIMGPARKKISIPGLRFPQEEKGR